MKIFILCVILMFSLTSKLSHASNQSVVRKIPSRTVRLTKCPTQTCKKGFDAALSMLKQDKARWQHDSSDALKAQGESACLNEISEFGQAGSLAVSGCDDCRYGAMSSELSAEIKQFNIQTQDKAEEAEEKVEEGGKSDELQFSQMDKMSDVFQKLRNDVMSDLKDECSPESTKQKSKIAKNHTNSNRNLKLKTSGGTSSAH